MTVVTQTHLEALARGETLPRDVFDAIVRDPAAVREVARLQRVYDLFVGEPDDAPDVADADTVVSLPTSEETRIELAPRRVRQLDVSLADRLRQAAAGRSSVNLRVVSSKSPDGKEVVLAATPDRAGYLTVLCWNAAGEMSVEYSGGEASHYTRAGKTEPLRFALGPGKETYGVVWTPQPWIGATTEWRRYLSGERVAMRMPTGERDRAPEAQTLDEDATWTAVVLTEQQA